MCTEDFPFVAETLLCFFLTYFQAEDFRIAFKLQFENNNLQNGQVWIFSIIIDY